MTKIIYMEDVTDVVVEVCDFVTGRLNLNLEQDGHLYDDLLSVLERICGHPDYRSYN